VDGEAWAWKLAHDLLAAELPLRWQHVQGVAERARTAESMVGADGEVLVCAALLHDVGYAPALVATGLHPLDGARYLASVGVDERLVNLVAHHSCAVLEADLRGLAAELADFPDEGPTSVRDALWWADMTTTPDGGRTNLVDRVAEIQDRYGPDDVVSCFIRWAWPELLAAVERTEERLSTVGVDYEK
jgi:putative nucleotidyltransferase with HDIG domain